jgi:hypothetical protein
MMFRRAALFACCLLAVNAATAQSKAAAQAETERVETGTVSAPTPPGSDSGPYEGVRPVPPRRHYSIRLLPVSSFPQLPAAVAQQLAERGCMIPQTYEAHEPENVIHGSFEKKGSSDWAALCSVNRVTTLYVFFQTDLNHAIALRHQPDSQWLGVEWSLDYGSAWGIATRPARLLPAGANADHDGIEDAFVEQSSTIHSFKDGRWTVFDGSQ